MATLNINVGVLGHVDSGKTSLSKALSTVASTNAFDKNPESKRRGITLDLGFSCFIIEELPCHLQTDPQKYTRLQFTLVDCPGHASLIKTIISGSQIIDIMMLVIDVTKGFQTQTKECLVIGEITCNKLIVVLNKCDLLDFSTREEKINKMQRKISKTLELTKFSGSPIVAVSANFGSSSDKVEKSEGIQNLIETLSRHVDNPTEQREKLLQFPFLFAVDHCFNITGQGTVLTGTVLSGSVSVSDLIELPYLKLEKKVKSMQVFREPTKVIFPVNTASTSINKLQGDRAGICISQLDSNLMERGIVSKPGFVSVAYGCILRNAYKIPYFKQPIKSKQKINVSICHEMVLATVIAFKIKHQPEQKAIDFESLINGSNSNNIIELLYEHELQIEKDCLDYNQYVLLEFDHPISCPSWGLTIGSKLDIDTGLDVCRLAFHGQIDFVLKNSKYKEQSLINLPVFKRKLRIGQLERVSSPRECIVKGLFKRETNWELFYNLNVFLEAYKSSAVDSETDECQALWSIPGRITGNFGQTGKCRIDLKDDLPEEIVRRFAANKKKTDQVLQFDSSTSIKVLAKLPFKRFIFSPHKRFVQ